MSTRPKTETKAKIFLVDDHPLVREWLSQLIQREPDLGVCGEAEDTHDALAKIGEAKPDIVIADISLKTTHGLELVKDLQAQFPKLPVLVLSVLSEDEFAARVLKAGAAGFVHKESSADELVRAVVLTGNGKSFCAGGDISGMKERLKAPAGEVAFNGWRRQGQTHKSVALPVGEQFSAVAQDWTR